jgi:hypothetical protein
MGGEQAPGAVTRDALPRRAFLARSAAAALSAMLLPLLEDGKVVAAAQAQSSDITTDTFNGLLAFVFPGSDEYSTHQGESTGRPGGVAANAVQTLIRNFDHAIPASVLADRGITLPASGLLAQLLNTYATLVNPLAIGPFPSAFSRLLFAQKAEVFRRIEADYEPSNSELAFVAGDILPYATFLAISEAGALDPVTRQVRGRPVGWDLTTYAGPSNGWPELRRYYGNRRRVRGSGPNATRVPK